MRRSRHLFLLPLLLLPFLLLPLLAPPEIGASLREGGVTRKELRFSQLKGDGELALRNLKTDEVVRVRYRGEDGVYYYDGLQQINGA